MLTLVDRSSDQIVQCRDRLPCMPMADEYRPALLPLVEGFERVAGAVSDLFAEFERSIIQSVSAPGLEGRG
jgi:hypothetical protein